MMASALTSQVAVVGGGPSGLIAAIALAGAGIETVLFAPPATGIDRRTTALLDGSVQVLRALDLWPQLVPHCAPLERMRLIDATRRLIRAPEVSFDCAELGLEAFGYNIENAILSRELRKAAHRLPALRIVEAQVEEIVLPDDKAILRTGKDHWEIKLVIAADGRHSISRKAAGIETNRHEFPQTALTMNLRHSRAHGNASTEFHTETGPFTLVPLPGMRSSLVWVLDPEQAIELGGLEDAAMALEVERRAHSILGRMEIDGPRGSFPLSIEIARRLASRRVVLVGEAGHVLPPIGAQGLNLGIRDAATAAELAADRLRAGEDPGGEDMMDRYENARRPDVRARALAVEFMNRSLLSDFLPIHAARGFGMELAARIGPLRRALMRQGIGPQDAAAPRLARGERI
jgi:2-octaprenyl-6-methoxyphenol hydroxylase